MATHVAILLKRYIDMILRGDKTMESRLTKTARPPYKQIQPGDRIYFKASSGPYMATAIADRVEFHDGLTPEKIAQLKRTHNAAVCGDDAYWTWKGDSRFAAFITLREVQPTREGPLLKPSTGIAWFVVEQDKPIEVELTDGALRNRYVRLPGEIQGEIALLLPDGKRVVTKVSRPSTVSSGPNGNRLLAWRGWGPYFKGLNPGDTMRLERAGDAYRVMFSSASSAKGKPRLDDFIDAGHLKRLIADARAEDLGPLSRDITSDALVPANLKTTAVMRSREVGVLCGAAVLEAIAGAYDPAIDVQLHMADGDALQKGSQVATFTGSLRSILAMERVALNFATHLSGIASQTARYVQAARGLARIYDTRKTTPGLRALEKYAVVCGGGFNHRIGLHDAMLVKDNHIAHLKAEQLERVLRDAIEKARAAKPPPAFIEVEVDTLEQLRHVLKLPVDVVLLDNMNLAQLREAAALRDQLAPSIELEASGGVKLSNVAAIARTGVNRIAVGAITHSAAALDLGLDILP